MPTLLLALVIPILVSCVSAVRQPEPPCWRNESCLSAAYPEGEWYLGFAEDALKIEQNAAEFRGMLERQARVRLAERIRVDISSRSYTETRSDYRSRDGSGIEEISRDFMSAIRTFSEAELVNSFADSYSDSKAKRVYAFAAVRKTDLALYYAKKMESAFVEAERSLGLAAQMAKADRKKDALDKLADSRKHVESAAPYRSLLLAVDAKSSLGGDERAGGLLKSIAALQIEIEKAAAVFVSCTESAHGQAASIIQPRLQTLLSESGVAVTENPEDASHVLSVESMVCDARHDEHFHYANACIKAVLTNVRTGKNEMTIAVEGKKEGGLSEYDAGERALRSAAAELWSKIKDKIKEISL